MEDAEINNAIEIIDPKRRVLIIFPALLALFLGAMDALIMSAAMPTVVAELGGIHLYSWVYSAYLLARAVSLPVFGKLGDLFKNRNIFIISIAVFLVSSLAAGLSPDMTFLIVSRVFQGIGSGGIFAMVYIVLADISALGQRARTMSFASSVWGIASVLGPTLGGFIVTYFSWRWIFFINVPLGLVSLAGIALFLKEIREKKKQVTLDILGVMTLSVSILGLLTIFLVGGRDLAWFSLPMGILVIITLVSGYGFILAEKRARDPILSLEFFTTKGFAMGNGAVFLASFAIFAMFAFAPIYIQGALGRSPMQVGLAMLSLSIGWSIGSLVLGQIVNRLGIRAAAIVGALLLIIGCGLTLTFDLTTSMVYSFIVFQIIGLGMGFVALATLIVVQNSVDEADLGVATSSQQFTRTFGGTVGIGICGGLLMARLARVIDKLQESGFMNDLPQGLMDQSQRSFEYLLRPEFQTLLPEQTRLILQSSIASSVQVVFWITVLISLLCLVCCCLLPGTKS